LQNISKRTFRRLDLNGYARFDYRVTEVSDIYLIEANPNPGIAYGEEFSNSAERYGIPYEEMISKTISLGLYLGTTDDNKLQVPNKASFTNFCTKAPSTKPLIALSLPITAPITLPMSLGLLAPV